MSRLSPSRIAEIFQEATDHGLEHVPTFVDHLLSLNSQHGVSDTHIDPVKGGVQIRQRIDGVLQHLGSLPERLHPNIVGRLKVLAGLLTYESALPQEGRIRDPQGGEEFRISTFPTLFGEKVVIRALGASHRALERLGQLGLPSLDASTLRLYLRATSGAVLVCGPAGSGKTTTAYACLREVVADSEGRRSIASLEDPIEAVVAGVSQSQVNEASGLDMATGLRSLLRQDPEVILVGEIRDRATAEIALQAALTGQLVVTTFHAGSSAEAIHRLVDMGLPGYAVRNAIRLIVSQRLVRRLCECAVDGDPEEDAGALGFAVHGCRRPVGCETCQQSGYRGRVLIAESLRVEDADVRQALGGSETKGDLAALVASAGHGDLWSAAERLIEQGVTSGAEASRVLGWKRAI